MPNKIFLYLKNFDWLLFAAVMLLICFGMVEIYSVSLGRGGIDLVNFQKQLFFILAGLGFMFFFAFFDYRNLRNFSNYIYLLGVLALLGVLFFGVTIRGTRGWFNFFGFGLQPVEFIKFVLLIFLARYFSGAALNISPLRHLLISGGGVFVLFALVLLQPDFGSGLILIAVWLSLIVIAGFNKKYLAAILLAAALVGVAGWFFYLKPYQKQRILTFANPSFDPMNQGYNVAQAIIAIGAGGLFGRGIGFGSQSQLKFLPESQNDFIFAVISEELGFFGVFLVIMFFALFFFRCLKSLKKINNDFGIFFILGAVSLIFVEMFVNIGMNIGILPVVGISLPFVSYGGSAMIANMIMVGVIESMIIRSKIR